MLYYWRILFTECKECAEAVYELEYPPVFDIDIEPIKVDTCAVVVQPLLIGGENANPCEVPHMVIHMELYWLSIKLSESM